MASAEPRPAYEVNHCFTRDFRMPPNSSDLPSSVTKSLESDWTPGNSSNNHANSGCMPHNPNSDRLPDMKWWLHVKTNLGDEANYTCQHLNSWESEFDACYSGFLGDNVKFEGDQSVKSFDAFSCLGSDNIATEQSWNVSPKCMKKNNDTKYLKIEAALDNEVQLTPKKKDQGEPWFSGGQILGCDIDSFLVSEQCKRTSSDLEPHWMGSEKTGPWWCSAGNDELASLISQKSHEGSEKTGPWWCSAGKDELASLISQKSHEKTENCDLPQPQIKHFRHRSALYTKGADRSKNHSSSLNQKADIGSSSANGYTSGTLTSGCSFQDSNTPFSSSQSKDSDSSNKDDQINSENNSKVELLKALCHSQTRAREAEKAAQQAYNEKEHILSLFFRQASQLFAYKQWLHVLQLENLCLQLKNKNQPLLNLFPAASPCRGKQHKSHHRAGKRKINGKRCGIRKYAVALVVGLGLASAGFLLGWTMGWMFPPL